MRRCFLVRLAVAVGLSLLLLVVPAVCDDFLVIKKRGGPTQKIPLPFPPEQIEGFQVESAPGRTDAGEEGAPSAETADKQSGPFRKRETPASPGQPEPKPMPIRPSGPPQEMKIFREDQQSRPSGETQYQQAPSSRSTRRQISGPVAADVPAGKGSLYANIYKLPENIRNLPDFSALRPVETLQADAINVDPSRGINELTGLPSKTDGLGMRFTGMFLVAGEGIFRWTVYSKDGARLHIDDKTVVDNDGIHEPAAKTGFVHLSEGVHSIVLDTFNAAGPPVLKLVVTPPLGPDEIFSVSKGLAGWKEPAKPYDVLWGQVYFVPKGKYNQGPEFGKITPIGRLTASELNISANTGFPGLPGRRDMVGIQYEGFFNVEGAGIFAFRLLADHWARLLIGDKEITELTGGMRSNPDGKIGWAFLQKGSYPIRVEYFHPEGQPRLELLVTQPTKPEEAFSPARTLEGFSSDEGKVSLIPAFVYFLKPGTRKMPSFNKLSPSGMFFTGAVDYPVDRGSMEFPGIPKRSEWLGIRFYVKFSLAEEESGNYKFRVVCRDSARLIIGNKLVINADETGRVQDKAGTVKMDPGSHEMFLDYMHTTGPNGIQLYITPPGGEERVFAFQ